MIFGIRGSKRRRSWSNRNLPSCVLATSKSETAIIPTGPSRFGPNPKWDCTFRHERGFCQKAITYSKVCSTVPHGPPKRTRTYMRQLFFSIRPIRSGERELLSRQRRKCYCAIERQFHPNPRLNGTVEYVAIV